MTRLSDTEIDRLRRGEPELLRGLVREHTSSLLGWVRSYADGPDESEDLVQEVWQRVLTARATYQGTGSFRGWLYQISRTVCVDQARRKSSQSQGRLRAAVYQGADVAVGVPTTDAWSAKNPEERFEVEATRLRVRSAVADLPPRQLEVVTLRMLEGMSTKATAELLDCAEGTVKASLSHALANLRERLGGDRT